VCWALCSLLSHSLSTVSNEFRDVCGCWSFLSDAIKYTKLNHE